MGTITAKQLKQKTGDIIRRVKSGECLTLTYRGKPIAVITPPVSENTSIKEEIRNCFNTGAVHPAPRFPMNSKGNIQSQP